MTSSAVSRMLSSKCATPVSSRPNTRSATASVRALFSESYPESMAQRVESAARAARVFATRISPSR